LATLFAVGVVAGVCALADAINRRSENVRIRERDRLLHRLVRSGIVAFSFLEFR